MIETLLVLVPALAGLAAFPLRRHTVRRALLLLAATAHVVLVAAAGWLGAPAAGGASWLRADAPGLLFLGIASVLFLAASLYAVSYLAAEGEARRTDYEEGFAFLNQPEAVFTGCLLLFLATMSLVCLSRHFGLMWVAIEATTLASAPLIYFHRHHRSLEATWKYLIICSVGIALALLGTFFLAVSASATGHAHSLDLDALLSAGPAGFSVPWLKAAFVFLLVGYGTKAGLAPLHTWLPDAHSEAPSVVSALLSGALLNCALLGVLRTFQVCAHAGQAAFAQPLLIGFGLVSMVVAAAFIVGQADYKRLLAYSSVEHIGVIAFGVGIGGAAATGAMFHAANHSLTKAALFLVSGNLLAAYRTKECGRIRGAMRALPVTGALWLAGVLAITGMPPGGVFLSKFAILRGAFERGHAAAAWAALAVFALIFVGMNTIALRMAQGEVPEADGGAVRAEGWRTTLPPMLLMAMVAVLGLYPPAWLQELLGAAGRCFAGGN